MQQRVNCQNVLRVVPTTIDILIVPVTILALIILMTLVIFYYYKLYNVIHDHDFSFNLKYMHYSSVVLHYKQRLVAYN